MIPTTDTYVVQPISISKIEEESWKWNTGGCRSILTRIRDDQVNWLSIHKIGLVTEAPSSNHCRSSVLLAEVAMR